MIVLQSFRDQLINGDLFGAIVDALASALPLPIVALFVFGTIGASYYLVQRRVIIPMIMLVLVGGVTIARAPAGFSAGILSVVIISLAGFAYLIFQRVSTQ